MSISYNLVNTLFRDFTQLPSVYDNTFKALVTAGWCVKSNGNVESTTGYFSITEIPSHQEELNEMKAALEDEINEQDLAWPESGWYFTFESNSGFLWAFKMTRDRAFKLYEQAEAEYADWDEAPNAAEESGY